MGMGKETIGEILKRLRAERKMSQRKLGELSGVNRSYINQIEHGKVKSITLDTARKFADALGYPRATFFGEDECRIDIQKLDSAIVRVPVYDDFPVHAGQPVTAMDYCYLGNVSPAQKTLEGYLITGDCLKPEIKDGDIVIVDREGGIENGNIVLCQVDSEVHIGRLRKIAGDYFLENNHARFKLEDISVMAPVIEVVRRLK